MKKDANKTSKCHLDLQQDRGKEQEPDVKPLAIAKLPTTERLSSLTKDMFHDAKRRRLSPPENEGSWFEQLQKGAREINTDDDLCPPHEIKAKSEAQKKVLPKPTDPTELVEMVATNVPVDAGATSTTQPVLQANPLNFVDLAEPSLNNTGLNKVMKLNGRGGLGSPRRKKKALQLDTVSEVSQSNSRARKRKTLIVKLRYEKDGLEERISMRQRINCILEISAVVSESRTLQPTLSTTTSNPGQLPPSTKSTHPFFLGKHVIPDTKEQPAIVTSPVKTSTRDLRPSAFLKAFTTPGRLKTQAWSNLVQESANEDHRHVYKAFTAFKLPGTVEPAWPPLQFVHISPDTGNLPRVLDSSRHRHFLQSFHLRKKKTKAIQINPEEQNLLKISKMRSTHGSNRLTKDQCQRLVLTGHEIQLNIREELTCRPIGEYRVVHKMSPGKQREISYHKADMSHPVLCRMFNEIATAVGYFDKGGCESQSWIQKHAPQSARDVLQIGTEALALKDWLATHIVNHVEGKAGAVSVPGQGLKIKHASSQDKLHKRRRRHKIPDELDGFIVSSDDETSEMYILDENNTTRSADMPRSMIREIDTKTSKKGANAVLLSGPHGCGKTAAAHAVAKELGFEVFEIGPGSRRNGRDILDRVGDMTLNHQVRKTEQRSDDPAAIDESLPVELEEQQSTLSSFFAAAQPKKKTTRGSKEEMQKSSQPLEKKTHPITRQKQSLILLEEVDVLYDEDKQFWETVLELALQSKRPIIMTCTDEALVPLHAMSLHAILRFQPPPSTIAEDYLILMAAVEGHLISREAVSNLYRSRKSDLRGSIMDLDFWCQMAVGDARKGIDWFLERWPPGKDLDECGRKLRVVSNKTYLTNMNIFGNSSAEAGDMMHCTEESMMRRAWTEWTVAPWSVSEQVLDIPSSWNSNCHNNITSSDGYAFLTDYGRCLDLCSSADVFATVDLPTTFQARDILDPTQPSSSTRQLADFTQGYPIVQADIKTDYGQLGTQMMTSTHLDIKHYFESQLPIYATSFDLGNPIPSASRIVMRNITAPSSSANTHPCLTRLAFSAAFDPISEPPSTTTTGANSSHPLLYSSSFDRPLTLITQDLAPYVRSIISFDLALEEQRHRISNLLSQSSDRSTGDGRSNKRLRTTRASRSALEGSTRATTRRERWFQPKTLDFNLVMRTAGSGWPMATAPGISTSDGEISRASSVDPLVV